jgi:hypothetical protein
MSEHRFTRPEGALEQPEAVGVFQSYDAFQAAIYDLMIAGFSRYDISVVASQEVLEEKFGKRYWTSPELADNPEAPRSYFVSEEAVGELEGAIVGGFFFIASYVALAAMLALSPLSALGASVAAVAVGGVPAATLGGWLARRVGKHHSEYYATQIRHGGILLWVSLSSPERERLAVEIMKGHSGRDVHVHPWSGT